MIIFVVTLTCKKVSVHIRKWESSISSHVFSWCYCLRDAHV